MNYAVIELGSNINPRKNIPAAILSLKNLFSLKSQSQFVPTKPIGPIQQPPFVNGAVLIETSKSLKELKNLLSRVEINLGRVRDANKYSPRTIDLDVIVWNGRIINDDFYTRDFVKQNVLEAVRAGHKVLKSDTPVPS